VLGAYVTRHRTRDNTGSPPEQGTMARGARRRGSSGPPLAGGPDGTCGGPGPIRDGLDTWQHRRGGLDGTHGWRSVSDCSCRAIPLSGPRVAPVRRPLVLPDRPKFRVKVGRSSSAAMCSRRGPALAQPHWVPHI
jgi:hypothetical protein